MSSKSASAAADVSVGMFSDSSFATAKDKALAVKGFLRFVESGFSGAKFTDRVYKFLHVHLSFIAHFDRAGFFTMYFTSEDGLAEFVEDFLDAVPRYAQLDADRWSDVAVLFDPSHDGRFVPVLQQAVRDRVAVGFRLAG